MEQLENNIKKLIKLMGFNDFSVRYEEENSRFSIFINEGGAFFKRLLPNFVNNLDYLAKLIASKNKWVGAGSVFIDINNYRRERENLILELARAAARKAASTKEEVVLPAMNAYERRLIHLELSSRPDISTESVGEKPNRYVVVKPI
jgi:predicted RNA-binding protein Jag